MKMKTFVNSVLVQILFYKIKIVTTFPPYSVFFGAAALAFFTGFVRCERQIALTRRNAACCKSGRYFWFLMTFLIFFKVRLSPDLNVMRPILSAGLFCEWEMKSDQYFDRCAIAMNADHLGSVNWVVDVVITIQSKSNIILQSSHFKELLLQNQLTAFLVFLYVKMTPFLSTDGTIPMDFV